MFSRGLKQTGISYLAAARRLAGRDAPRIDLLKMGPVSYSIGYALPNTSSVAGVLKISGDISLIRQTAYRSVTLSPGPAPLLTDPEARAVPQFDDDFFETAFEGLAEARPPETPADYQGGVPALGAIRGYLEDCRPNRIAGWAQDPRPGAPPVRVAIMLGRIVLADLMADQWRADLSAASIGTGSHAFEFRPSPPIARDLLSAVKVICAADKKELPRAFELVNQ